MFNELTKYFVGADEFFKPFADVKPGFPFYNVVQEKDSVKVEFTVPGWSKDEIQVTQLDGIIRVEANKRMEQDNYLYKGITSKAFMKSIPFAPTMEFKGATLDLGILTLEFGHKANETGVKVEINEPA